MIIQAQVLNKMLANNDSSLLISNNLDDEYFSDYLDEFHFIKEHFDNYGRIPDVATFVAKFPDFVVLKVEEPNNYLIDELVKDRNTRLLASIFNKVRDLLMKNKVDEALSVYTTAQESVVKAKHFQSTDLLVDTSRYDAYVERCRDFEKYYVKTGFNELDKLIGGWDRNEELATISARPGVGKTWILLKCAVAALEQGLTVGVYSGEMSTNKVGYRFDTLSGHISNYGITRGNADLQNEYKRHIDSLRNRFSTAFKVLTPNDINGPAGVTALRAFIEQDKLDILFVDQHSLLEDDRRARNPVEKAANISRDLKNLQVMEKIPIIAVSQQNRNDTSAGVDVSHIAQSDRISQDSTIVIFLEQKDDILTLNLSKARDAVNNQKLRYASDIDRGIFEYLPSSEDGVTSEETLNNLKSEFEEDVL